MRLLLPALLAILLSVSFHGAAHAQYAYDPAYGAAPGGPPPWSAEDEAWLHRNRTFALVGKILTVVGAVGWVVGGSTEQWGVFGASGTLYYGGQLLWAGSELRGAKELRRRGIEVSKAPGIAAVVGAAFNIPLVVWIAGPIQSARIRQVRDELTPYAQPRARLSPLGLGLSAQF